MPRVKTKWLVGLTIAIAFVIIVLEFVKIISDEMHIGFAREQIDIFSVLEEDAMKSTDRRFVLEHIEAVRDYYPSGTKQDTGSHLDHIVELHRERVITKLRHYYNSLEK